MAWVEAGQPLTVPHVCVCVPHFGSVSLEWVESTYGPLRFVPQSDFAKSSKLSRGILNLDTERNELVKYALEDKTVTHLLFLDTDCIIESPPDINQAVRHLLAINVPVVSGLYRAKKAKGLYPYAMWARNPGGGIGYVDLQQWTGNYLKVDAIGFGFVLLKREVFEKIPFPWFVWDKPVPSEDFDFCQKMRQYGYDINVFTEVCFSHAGTMKVKTAGEVHVLDV